MKRFADVRFITASEAARLYRDKARGRAFAPEEIKAIATAVGDDVTFQKHGDIPLSPAEVFALLNEAVVCGPGKPVVLPDISVGPTAAVPAPADPVATGWGRFQR